MQRNGLSIMKFTLILSLNRLLFGRGRFDRGEDLDGPSMPDFDANNIFQMFFGGGSGPSFSRKLFYLISLWLLTRHCHFCNKLT